MAWKLLPENLLMQFSFMKKLLVGSFFLCFLSVSASAQYYDEAPAAPAKRLDIRRIRIGAYIAPNISWMKPTAAKSNDGDYRVSSLGSKVGFSWGIMADYFFAPNYGISTGFQLNSTGGKIEANRIESAPAASSVYRASFDYSLQFLEIPFNLKLQSDPIAASGIKVFGQIGLTAGINIGKKATYSVGYTDQFGAMRTVTGEKERLFGGFAIAPLMLQLNVGGGLVRPITEKMSLYFGMFFNNGFLPDVTNPKDYTLGYQGNFSDGNVRQNSFSFRLGLFF